MEVIDNIPVWGAPVDQAAVKLRHWPRQQGRCSPMPVRPRAPHTPAVGCRNGRQRRVRPVQGLRPHRLAGKAQVS